MPYKDPKKNLIEGAKRAKKWRENHREQEHETRRLHRINHPEYHKERDFIFNHSEARKLWEAEHDIDTKEYQKLYRQSHKTERAEANKRWRADHADRCRELKQNWRANHVDTVRRDGRVYRANRLALIRESEGSYTATDIALILDAQDNLCYYCGEPLGRSYHVDHKQPVSRGGSNWPENLAVTCPTCNLRKSDKTEAEFRFVNTVQMLTTPDSESILSV